MSDKKVIIDCNIMWIRKTVDTVLAIALWHDYVKYNLTSNVVICAE